MQSYLQSDFKTTLAKFEALSNEDKGNENILFLKANALLATNQTELAIKILDKICLDKTSNYLIDAQWYEGLAYLKLGNLDKAKSRLQFISTANNGKHPYAKEANRLLNEMLRK